MKKILEYTPCATRLIDFFYNSFITRIDNVSVSYTHLTLPTSP
jgi:hypothetical protein